MTDPRSSIHDHRSTMTDPQSSIHDDRSTMTDPRSSIHNDRSTMTDPRSSIHDDRYAIQNTRSETKNGHRSQMGIFVHNNLPYGGGCEEKWVPLHMERHCGQNYIPEYRSICCISQTRISRRTSKVSLEIASNIEGFIGNRIEHRRFYWKSHRKLKISLQIASARTSNIWSVGEHHECSWKTHH